VGYLALEQRLAEVERTVHFPTLVKVATDEWYLLGNLST
jgi:hypothetical protein